MKVTTLPTLFGAVIEIRTAVPGLRRALPNSRASATWLLPLLDLWLNGQPPPWQSTATVPPRGTPVTVSSPTVVNDDPKVHRNEIGAWITK